MFDLAVAKIQQKNLEILLETLLMNHPDKFTYVIQGEKLNFGPAAPCHQVHLTVTLS
jgi:hypothetical protein